MLWAVESGVEPKNQPKNSQTNGQNDYFVLVLKNILLFCLLSWVLSLAADDDAPHTH